VLNNERFVRLHLEIYLFTVLFRIILYATNSFHVVMSLRTCPRSRSWRSTPLPKRHAADTKVRVSVDIKRSCCSLFCPSVPRPSSLTALSVVSIEH